MEVFPSCNKHGDMIWYMIWYYVELRMFQIKNNNWILHISITQPEQQQLFSTTVLPHDTPLFTFKRTSLKEETNQIWHAPIEFNTIQRSLIQLLISYFVSGSSSFGNSKLSITGRLKTGFETCECHVKRFTGSAAKLNHQWKNRTPEWKFQFQLTNGLLLLYGSCQPILNIGVWHNCSVLELWQEVGGVIQLCCEGH